MRYALKIAYDGTRFCGWQVQKNGNTVQAELERAIKEAFGVDARVCASGRTDSGVHALGQVAHVDLPVSMAGERLADALNSRLCEDISVLSSCVAGDGFDANRSAKKKTYRYTMYVSSRRNPILDRFALRVDSADAEAMREAAVLFCGVHDFKAYCASGSSALTTVREIYSVNVERREDLTDIYVCGNGFLYNMVRTLAGTLLWYSMGKISKEDIISSLEEGLRERVGKTLPARGLCLMSVDYGSRGPAL